MSAVVVLSAVICSQHELLVGHRLRDGDRRAKRGDRGGRGAVDALHQLDIVLLDEVEREIALHRHRHLRQQVGRALARVEQRASRGSPWPWPDRSRRARWPCPRAAGRGVLEMWTICSSLCIVFHRLGALGVDRGIVHQQLVLAVGEAAEDLRNVRLRAAVFVEIAVDAVAERDDAEQSSGSSSPPWDRGPRRCGEARSRSAPMPVSLSIALTGRSRKRFEAPAASAISLRPIAVSWSTFLPNSGLLASSAASSSTNCATRLSSSLVSSLLSGTRPAASAGGTRLERLGRVELELGRGLSSPLPVRWPSSKSFRRPCAAWSTGRSTLQEALRCIIGVRQATQGSQAEMVNGLNHRLEPFAHPVAR